jgi:hypothetical protein
MSLLADHLLRELDGAPRDLIEPAMAFARAAVVRRT